MRNCVPSKEAAKAIAKMESAIPGADKQCPKCGLFKVNCICIRKPRQRLWQVALQSDDENWTKHLIVMAMTSLEAWKQAGLRKGYRAKTKWGDQPDLTSVVPFRENGKQVMIEPISRALQSLARGFFAKLFGKRRNQDHCRGDGKPLCKVCSDTARLWLADDGMVRPFACASCLTDKQVADVNRGFNLEILLEIDRERAKDWADAHLRQPVCI